jgi:DNA-binding PucR family transcriptional regulator
VEPQVLVREVVGRLAASTRLRALERLREHDSRTGGQLLETLRTYLVCTGSATHTAATLEVHVTTLRHRLRRIEQVSGLSLAEPAVRIACGLVLRLHKA